MLLIIIMSIIIIITIIIIIITIIIIISIIIIIIIIISSSSSMLTIITDPRVLRGTPAIRKLDHRNLWSRETFEVRCRFYSAWYNVWCSGHLVIWYTPCGGEVVHVCLKMSRTKHPT